MRTNADASELTLRVLAGCSALENAANGLQKLN
jgi:hypothetical protein